MDGPGQAATTVLDVPPTRVRRALDLLRLCGQLVTLAILLGLGSVARDTGRGVSADLNRLVHQAPNPIVHAFAAIGAFAALAVPLMLVVREILRARVRLLIEAALTGLLALGVAEGLSLLLSRIPSSPLYGSLTRLGDTHVRPLDAYLAALIAFVTVAGLAEPAWRTPVLGMTAVYLSSTLVGTTATVLSLLVSIVLGGIVGRSVRYLAGRPNEQPGGAVIAAELVRIGLPVTRIERVLSPGDDDDETHRTYVASAAAGPGLTLHVFDRDVIASGAVHTLYRLTRLRREIAPVPALSLERVAERRAALAMAAAAVGVPIPRLVAAVPCGADTIVLAYETVDGVALLDPTDEQLDAVWGSLEALHRQRVTHRGMRVGAIRVDAEGQIVLPIASDGNLFAMDVRIALDRVQLLATGALLVGAVRSIDSARRALGSEALAAMLPLLQPIALPQRTRADLRRRPVLLDELREGIQASTSVEVPELVRVERVRPRTVVTVVAVIVASYLIIGQLGSVNLGSVLASASWRWVPFVLAASVATYFAAALSLIGYVQEKLSFSRTVMAQVAASFAGFVTPPSVGGLAINIRFLRKAKLTTTAAATSVGMAQVVNGAAHVSLLIVFAAITGTASQNALPIPGWAFIALLAAVGAGLLAIAIPGIRRPLTARLVPPLREALPRLLDLATSPLKLAEGVSGALLLNASYVLALWAAVHAFGGGVGFAAVAVVYLAGAAIGSLAPTPGGLGAIEVALSTGLAAAGMPGAASISAVLLYRLATFWLPVPAGWLALSWLQRRDAV